MNNIGLPSWYDDLHQRLTSMAEDLQSRVTGWQERPFTVTPEELGYDGGLATAAIQAAIDRAAEQGGGTVEIRQDMVTGTLVMKSHVRLMIAAGAKLLASTDLAGAYLPARHRAGHPHGHEPGADLRRGVRKHLPLRPR